MTFLRIEVFAFLVAISVSYDENDLKYKWKGKVGSPIYIYDEEMAQFDVISAQRFLKHEMYHSRK